MAKWKVETGGVINGTGKNNYYMSIYFIKTIIPNVSDYAPIQVAGEESDFTILLKDGKTIKATLIKEPKDLMEYWEQNKVKLFNVYDGGSYYNLCHDSYKFIASLPSSWTLDRQIDALNKLIEIYKD